MPSIIGYKAKWTEQVEEYQRVASVSVMFTSAAVGGTLRFQAIASGFDGNPTFQWQISSGGSFSNVSGATGEVYEKTAASSDEGKLYRVVATYSGSSVTSDFVEVELEA